MDQAAGRDVEARATLDRLLEEQPEYHCAHYNLAILLHAEQALAIPWHSFAFRRWGAKRRALLVRQPGYIN